MRWTGLTSAAFVLMSISPSGLSPAAPGADPARAGLLVTVGEVTDTRAALWVRGDRPAPVSLRYRPAGEPEATTATIVPDPAADGTGRADLAGLRPRTRYVYELAQGADRVVGVFGTAPPPAADTSVRLLWSADLGAANHCRDVEGGYAIFDAMRRRRADFFLFLGDTIYADQTCGPALHVPGADFVAATLDEYHRKHRYNRADPAVQRFLRTTPVFATWDDHDVTNNFAGPTEPLMPVGRRAFLDYWPVAAPPDEPTRIYRRLRWGRHAEVFVLDLRQYRSPNTAPDGPDKSMLGPAQRAWLLDGLRRSDATWKVVVSTVPLGMFTGGVDSDSWSAANALGFQRSQTGFRRERDALLAAFREADLKNVVVLAGDVHHAELIRHEPLPGLVLHEFTAGPLAARQGFARFLDRSLHSRSLGSLGWANNFGEMTIDRDWLVVRIMDTEGASRVSLRLHARPGIVEAGARPGDATRFR